MARPEQLRQREKENRSARLSFPSKALPHSILLNFKRYNYSELYGSIKEGEGIGTGSIRARSVSDSGSIAQITGESSVELPFPKQLSDATTINAGGFERSLVGDAIASVFGGASGGGSSAVENNSRTALKSIVAGLRAAGEATADLMQGNSDALASNAKSSLAAASYFMRNQMDGVAGKTISNAQGNAINPKETMAFNGVQLKTHAFTWELFPSNESDSVQIRQIIKMIKTNVLPGTAALGGMVNRAFLEYPSLVDIYLLGVDEDYFFKFKPCMVTAFNVTYTGGDAMPILKGGKPAMVVIEMTMTEMQIHTKEDMDEKYAEEVITEEARKETQEELIANAARGAAEPNNGVE